MRWLACLSLCACAFQRTNGGPGAGDDDGQRMTIVDDATADFAGTAVDGAVTPWGTIEPAAFVVGGLHAHGFNKNNIADADTYDMVVAKSTAPLAEGYAQLPADWQGSRPRGLGLPTNSDQFTILYDGEILLPQGGVDLAALADDRAIVQVALDGTTFGERLFSHNATATIHLDVPASGWYPIRAAYGEEGGNARFSLTIQPANLGVIPVGADRLRARVTDVHGLVAFAFGTTGLLPPVGETAVTTIDADFKNVALPYDVDAPTDRFSLRYTGQIRFDTEGDHMFSVDKGPDVDDGFRVFVDGKLVASHWLGTPELPMGTVHVTPGWHDLVVDYAEGTGNAKVTVKLDGQTLPAEQLRPAIARGLTAAQFAAPGTSTPIVLGAQTQLDLPLPGDDTMRVDWVDYAVNVSNHNLQNLTLELFDCMGSQPLSMASPLTGSFGAFFYYAADTRCHDAPMKPPSPWHFRLTDSNPPGPSLAAASNYGIVAAYHGGPRTPFSTVTTYTSQPHATPGATRLIGATVTGELHGAVLALAVRVGTDEAALAAAPWIDIGNGSENSLDGGELVQYKLTLTGDGWQYPVIDKVALDYIAP